MTVKWLVSGVLFVACVPVHAGTITLASTPYPDSVIIQATIQDTGGEPGCAWIAITRNGVDVFYIERQPGATISRRLVDTGVQPSTLYCYGAALRLVPGVEGPCTDTLCDLFDCFYQIQTCANTGPDPAFIGHGFLSTQLPDGSPVDFNEVQALLYRCGETPQDFIGLHTVSTEVQAYVDTGTAVDVYGSPWCCWSQGVWLLVAEAAEPHTCIIAVDGVHWSEVKRLYRERD
jgi:hypothetical protein